MRAYTPLSPPPALPPLSAYFPAFAPLSPPPALPPLSAYFPVFVPLSPPPALPPLILYTPLPAPPELPPMPIPVQEAVVEAPADQGEPMITGEDPTDKLSRRKKAAARRERDLEFVEEELARVMQWRAAGVSV